MSAIDTQCQMEDYLLDNGYATGGELWEELSRWLDSDTMCEFLHDYMRYNDIHDPFDED